MSFFEVFAEGAGMKMLIAALLAALAAVGVAVRLSGKREYFGEILVPSSLIAFSILIFAITFSFPVEEAGPAAVPRLWVFWMVVLCASILWQVSKTKGKTDSQPSRWGFLLLVMVMVIAYYFAIQTIGYFISSFLFLVLLMHILSYKNKIIIYSVAAGWVLFSYAVFYKLLYIQLPLGFFEYYF